MTQQPWFQAVEPEGHDRMRLFGRRLLSLLMQQPRPRRQRLELLAEARLLGQEYGTEMLERNVSLTDTVEAFVFFRTMVLDSADTGSWPSILETSDRVLAGVCSSYQRAAAPGRCQPSLPLRKGAKPRQIARQDTAEPARTSGFLLSPERQSGPRE